MKAISKLDFHRFLMKQGAFKKFYANQKERSNESCAWTHNSKCPVQEWVTFCGFMWQDAKEGFWYWLDIHKAWEKYLSL